MQVVCGLQLEKTKIPRNRLLHNDGREETVQQCFWTSGGEVKTGIQTSQDIDSVGQLKK